MSSKASKKNKSSRKPRTPREPAKAKEVEIKTVDAEEGSKEDIEDESSEESEAEAKEGGEEKPALKYAKREDIKEAPKKPRSRALKDMDKQRKRREGLDSAGQKKIDAMNLDVLTRTVHDCYKAGSPGDLLRVMCLVTATKHYGKIIRFIEGETLKLPRETALHFQKHGYVSIIQQGE